MKPFTKAWSVVRKHDGNWLRLSPIRSASHLKDYFDAHPPLVRELEQSETGGRRIICETYFSRFHRGPFFYYYEVEE